MHNGITGTTRFQQSQLVVVYIPPQSNINKNTKVQFIEEFGDFVEKLLACSGYFVEISTSIGWIRKTQMLINFSIC